MTLRSPGNMYRLLWFYFPLLFLSTCNGTTEFVPITTVPSNLPADSTLSTADSTPSTPEVTTKAASPTRSNLSQHLDILDKIIKDYDKREWPTFQTPGEPTHVEVSLYINSFGPVNAANMEYGLDMYLRQMWLDERLNISRYGFTHAELTLNGGLISSSLWKPDLFFRNAKQAFFHQVTAPNQLVKMYTNGTILYSMRLTARLACHMSFGNYPLDTQFCYMEIGTYAQPTDQTVLEWRLYNTVDIDPAVAVPEFIIVKTKTEITTRTGSTGNFSFLNATFVLKRENGYHVVQTYLPTFLIVMISWVSFWLHVDASPARVTLGVTTLLTLTTVASGVRTQLPPVSYVKAIDVWIGTCLVMVFGALLEFALVNFLSRSEFTPDQIKHYIDDMGACKKCKESGTEPASKNTEMSAADIQKFNLKRAKRVDKLSRVIFPLAFVTFNIVYWTYYLQPTRY